MVMEELSHRIRWSGQTSFCVSAHGSTQLFSGSLSNTACQSGKCLSWKRSGSLKCKNIVWQFCSNFWICRNHFVCTIDTWHYSQVNKADKWKLSVIPSMARLTCQETLKLKLATGTPLTPGPSKSFCKYSMLGSCLATSLVLDNLINETKMSSYYKNVIRVT